MFNSVPQSAAEYVARMRELGVRWFRIDLLRETPEEAIQLVEQYRRVLAGTDGGRQRWKKLKAVNQLGVTRGTSTCCRVIPSYSGDRHLTTDKF